MNASDDVQSMNNQQMLFVLGAPKTSTSTVVAILNSSPDIFLLFEARLFEQSPLMKKRAELFLNRYPEAKKLFEGDPRDRYKNLREHFQEYKFVGEKIPGTIDLTPFEPHKIIFTIRDIRTWLCKEKVIRRYYINHDIALTAVDYVSYFLKSLRRFNDLCVVRMEDAINKNDDVLNQISSFVGVEREPLTNWWEKVGNYNESDPKAHWPWWEGHPSSQLEPRQVDVNANLKSHPFWDVLLPVFDKYYSGSFDPADIPADLEVLESIQNQKLELSELYADYKDVQILDPSDTPLSNRLRKTNAFARIKQIVNKLKR